MLKRLQARQPGTPLYYILWWQFYQTISFIWFVACYRFRSWGVRTVPCEGPVLLLSNHQSYLDPIAIGLGVHKRQFHALARKTLWDSWLFRTLTKPLNSIPVDQESDNGDIKAMKTCIDRLNAGHAVLVFPEGSRCDDGRTHDFQPGTLLLIKRARPTVIPVAVQGPFDVWPPGQKLPKLFGRIGCIYGKPIPADDLLAMPKGAAMAHLRDTVEAMRLELAERLAR